jgi:hypothetical protein
MGTSYDDVTLHSNERGSLHHLSKLSDGSFCMSFWKSHYGYCEGENSCREIIINHRRGKILGKTCLCQYRRRRDCHRSAHETAVSAIDRSLPSSSDREIVSSSHSRNSLELIKKLYVHRVQAMMLKVPVHRRPPVEIGNHSRDLRNGGRKRPGENDAWGVFLDNTFSKQTAS